MKTNPYVLVIVFAIVAAGLIFLTNKQFVLQQPQQAIAQGQQEQSTTVGDFYNLSVND
jgi:hypothetical protein